MDSNKSEDKKTSFPSYRQGRFERAIFPFLKFEKYYVIIVMDGGISIQTIIIRDLLGGI